MWKVLIADDEPKIRLGLKTVLEEMELSVTVCAEARNGIEALEKTRQCQPDFLLLDICMPRLSGIQFLEELRKINKDCPVIVISGFNEFAYAKQAMKLGVSEYLLKPIAEEELRRAYTPEIMQRGSMRSSDCLQVQQKGLFLSISSIRICFMGIGTMQKAMPALYCILTKT